MFWASASESPTGDRISATAPDAAAAEYNDHDDGDGDDGSASAGVGACSCTEDNVFYGIYIAELILRFLAYGVRALAL